VAVRQRATEVARSRGQPRGRRDLQQVAIVEGGEAVLRQQRGQPIASKTSGDTATATSPPDAHLHDLLRTA